MNRIRRLLHPRITGGVSFCDSCGKVCDAYCRSEATYRATRDRALTRALPIG